MSRACSFPIYRACFSNLVLSMHCFSEVIITLHNQLRWKGVVMSCRASLASVCQSTTSTEEIWERPGRAVRVLCMLHPVVVMQAMWGRKLLFKPQRTSTLLAYLAPWGHPCVFNSRYFRSQLYAFKCLIPWLMLNLLKKKRTSKAFLFSN